MSPRPGLSEAPRVMRFAATLRCPRCGWRPVFTSWFRMTPSCHGCGLVFEREPGFFVGSIYLNYGFTTGLLIAVYLLLEWLTPITANARLVICGLLAVGLPILFFRHARLLWIGLGILLDPPG